MTLVKENSMRLEDVRLNKPSKLSIKQEVKRTRELNINNMSTSQIMWHLAVRHKFSLMTMYATGVTVLLVLHWN